MPVLDAWRMAASRAGRPASAVTAAVGALLANDVCNERVWPGQGAGVAS